MSKLKTPLFLNLPFQKNNRKGKDKKRGVFDLYVKLSADTFFRKSNPASKEFVLLIGHEWTET